MYNSSGRKCPRVPVWHSSDLDLVPQNLLETTEKITIYKKTRPSASSLGLWRSWCVNCALAQGTAGTWRTFAACGASARSAYNSVTVYIMALFTLQRLDVIYSVFYWQNYGRYALLTFRPLHWTFLEDALSPGRFALWTFCPLKTVVDSKNGQIENMTFRKRNVQAEGVR